jgi:hypothetical protein
MKPFLILTLAVLALSIAEASDERLQRSEFPRLGATYSLTFESGQQGYLPSVVKIIGKGDAQWYFVEYEKTEYPKRRITKNPEAQNSPTPEPTPKPTPTVTTERQWINFALLLAAEEVK